MKALKVEIEMKIMKGLIDSVVMKELIGHIFSGRNERNESGFH